MDATQRDIPRATPRAGRPVRWGVLLAAVLCASAALSGDSTPAAPEPIAAAHESGAIAGVLIPRRLRLIVEYAKVAFA